MPKEMGRLFFIFFTQSAKSFILQGMQSEKKFTETL